MSGPLFGAHMSAAGGLPRAVERAVVHGCDALQVFTKNAIQWRGRPLATGEVREFRARLRAARIRPVVSHASYLINLATADPVLRRQSMEAMADEIDRAEALGLRVVVLHPGCSTSGRPERGLELVADALVDLLRDRPRGRAMVLLEQTAGQGTALGATFEQLAAIIDRTRRDQRVGVCLDTCHLLAAGYDLTSDSGYQETFDRFARIVGFERLRVVHVNDSQRPLGSRVDRHAHIGQGYLGVESFRRLVNDPRLAGIPLVLETPKSPGKATGPILRDPLDVQNLTLLRSLVADAAQGLGREVSRSAQSR